MSEVIRPSQLNSGTPMGKHKKKKKSKKIAEAMPDDMLDAAVVSIKKFRQITNEIAKLSTGQKLVGGLVLAAAGYFYLDQRRGYEDTRPRHAPKLDWPRLAETNAATATDDASKAPDSLPNTHKSHKATKTKKPRSVTARRPAAAADRDDL